MKGVESGPYTLGPFRRQNDFGAAHPMVTDAGGAGSYEPGVLTDQVVGKLENLILDGHYKPGDKLREQSLAEELGVSRGPLREAIRTLEGRRLLKRTPRSGVQVVGLSIDDLDQIFITRESLEGMAARLAAENMTVAEVNALRNTLSVIERRPRNAAKVVFGHREDSDNDFHRLIADGSRNPWLAGFLKDLLSLLRLYRIKACSQAEVAKSFAEHHEIIDKIFARDADAAEKAMRAHMKGIRERTLALVRR